MKKAAKYVAIGIVLAFVTVQFIPADLPENNLDTSNDIIHVVDVPATIEDLLLKSCFDCHSNQTSYPWYSYIAPISWLIAKDTRHGREELNFSDWADMSKRKKVRALSDVAEEVEEGKMPLPIYTVVHSNAILGDEEKNAIIDWAKQLSDQIMEAE